MFIVDLKPNPTGSPTTTTPSASVDPSKPTGTTGTHSIETNCFHIFDFKISFNSTTTGKGDVALVLNKTCKSMMAP